VGIGVGGGSASFVMSNGKIQMSSQFPNQNVKKKYYHFVIGHWDFIWSLDFDI
jgi:hypothetical protein